MILAPVCILSGLLIVALVQLDILTTVLHPEVESWLSTHFQQIIWRVLTRVERIVPHRNGVNVVLNWALPLMIAGLISLWLILLVVGFALIYYPWIGNEAAFVLPNPVNRTFVTALYYSGVTLATVGYGDIQPLAWPLRILAVVQAILGVATLSLGIAYVLAVYPALSRKRTFAAALDAEVAGQAHGLPMVRRYLTEQQQWSADLATRLRELALELLALTEVHETHPVLYYAHPRRVQHSFLRILVTAQSLAGLLRYGLSPDRHPEIVRNPQLLLLEQALHYSLRRLSASLHVSVVNPDIAAVEHQLVAEHRQVCRSLEQLGLVSACATPAQPVPVLVETDIATNRPAGQQDLSAPLSGGARTYEGEPLSLDPALDFTAASPVEAYIVFRLETDPYLAAYAAACGYPLEVARASYETTWWVGGR